MNSSPPKASNSSRPPAALGAADGGRRVTAMAAGGSVLLLSAAAVALWPRTYGTEATFVVEGGAITNAAALAARVEATLLERDELSRVAVELPTALRSPDPIGRLRAGIHVQSRGPLGYVVEFRGSEPKSVQRIANLLAERAVALVPKLAAAPQDQAPAQALAERTRAVTEFLTAHPEVTIEPPSGVKATPDTGLEALRTEKRQIEQRLSAGATDNPYADPEQSPELLNRRLAELKNTIARREKALKEPDPKSPPSPVVSPELVGQWRQLLAELATAESAATKTSGGVAPATARLTARAPLPSSPITPNRLLLSLVALLLSAAAALVAYVLPRKPEPARRGGARAVQPGPVESPSAVVPGLSPSEPPPRVEPSTSPPALGPRPGSEPPGPIAVQRTVVLTAPSRASAPSPAALLPARSPTSPGGMEAPAAAASAATTTVRPPSTGYSQPAAPLFGSRPPPGAGSYSVSSSHPPPMDSRSGSGRTSVEKLSPLHSAHPPSGTTPPGIGPTRPAASPTVPAPSMPQIVSRPPALDPEAESWAARFEAAPPAEPTRPTHPQPTQEETDSEPRKRNGRWKTQVMGSMVPLEVTAVREEVPPPSEALESVRARQVPSPSATTIVHHEVPLGWAPQLDSKTSDVTQLRDAVLRAATGLRLTLLVTGTARSERAQLTSALGLALAEAGARTLLVEADFDNPGLHRVLSLSPPPGAGFSQQLMARRSARQREPWTVMRCSNNLGVIPESRFRSPGLVVSREFEGALSDLSEQHHIVLIHAPSLAHREDLRPLGGFAHGVVLVEPNAPSQLRLGEDPLSGLV
jgi:Mrp family chromosome partitioning ATPase